MLNVGEVDWGGKVKSALRETGLRWSERVNGTVRTGEKSDAVVREAIEFMVGKTGAGWWLKNL